MLRLNCFLSCSSEVSPAWLGCLATEWTANEGFERHSKYRWFTICLFLPFSTVVVWIDMFFIVVTVFLLPQVRSFDRKPPSKRVPKHPPNEGENLPASFQENVGIGSGPQELGQFLISHMDPTLRKEVERELVEHYYQELLRTRGGWWGRSFLESEKREKWKICEKMVKTETFVMFTYRQRWINCESPVKKAQLPGTVENCHGRCNPKVAEQMSLEQCWQEYILGGAGKWLGTQVLGFASSRVAKYEDWEIW